jgi:hypothetical protein
MASQVFVVVPYAGKWGVSAGGEVLAVAGSKSAAQDLARKASEALRPGGPAGPQDGARIRERRSFIES